jgi:hypothetical protein
MATRNLRTYANRKRKMAPGEVHRREFTDTERVNNILGHNRATEITKRELVRRVQAAKRKKR